jgi:hypothetical protein
MGGGAAASGAGGGVGAALLGAGLGASLIGGGTRRPRAPVFPQLESAKKLQQQALARLTVLRSLSNASTKMAKRAFDTKSPNWPSLYEQSLGFQAAAQAGLGAARESRRNLKNATADAVSKGTQVGLLKGLRKALRLWHFLIGGLITGFIVGGVKRMMSPALQYIRNTGTTTGRYGRFSNAMEATPSALRNVNVQFGLMAIQLLNLDDAMQGFNRILVQTGSVMAWLGEQKWLKAILLSHPNVLGLRALNWALGKLPTGKGGVDLGGGGFSGRMAPAALEGSVETYRTIQGRMMDYAAQTARNTAETSATLQKIVDRAPLMGVVNP